MCAVQVVRSINPGLLNHTSSSAQAESLGYWLETKFQAVIIISLKTSVQYRPSIGKGSMILWFNVAGVGDVRPGRYGPLGQP